MAKPIAPTPELHGKAAVEFIAELEKNKGNDIELVPRD